MTARPNNVRRPSRRHFLRGAMGATVGLPLLESLRPRDATAQASDKAVCVAVLWENNGVNMDKFWPETPYGELTEAAFSSGRAIDSLLPYREHLLIPRGLNMVGRGGHLGTHALTATEPLPFDGLDEMQFAWARGISLDRALAQQINPDAVDPLTLVTTDKGLANVYDTVSYRGANDAVFPEQNPWTVYGDMVGLDAAGNAATDLLVARRRSVLDLVDARLQVLASSKLSQRDKTKLELHFDSLRDLEQRLVMTHQMCALSEQRAAEFQQITPDAVREHSLYSPIGRMHLDIMAIAFACGINRVGTLMFGSEAGGPAYDFDGLDHVYRHHPLSHGTQGEATDSGGVADYKERLYEVDAWHASQFKYFLDRLSAYEEDAGTLLDRCCVVWMNSMSDGNAHTSSDMPIVMAGRAAGYLNTGRFVNVQENGSNVPHNLLLTTLMNAAGVPEKHFGDRALGRPGQLEQLLA